MKIWQQKACAKLALLQRAVYSYGDAALLEHIPNYPPVCSSPYTESPPP
jgi:hypothetical protein